MFRFWNNLFRWSGILVPSCLINILQSTALVISQFGVLMVFGWVLVNTESEKKSLCILSCSDPLILPSIDIFLLIVSHYISWSGYWCSSCAVSLWCLPNVSICTPISCFFIHPHLLLSIGHPFVPNHVYLQCFDGEERGMTVYVSVLFSTSVVTAFETGWLFIYCVHHWYYFEKKRSLCLVFSSLGCNLQVFHLGGRIWGSLTLEEWYLGKSKSQCVSLVRCFSVREDW